MSAVAHSMDVSHDEEVVVDRLVTAGELSSLLLVAKRTPYNRVWQRRVGLFPIKIGGSIRFRVKDIERLLQEGSSKLDGKGRSLGQRRVQP